MKQNMRKVLALLLAMVMVFGLMSTAWADETFTPSSSVNINASSSSAKTGESVNLSANVSLGTGETAASYSWTTTGGSVSGNGANATFSASTAGKYIVTLVVTFTKTETAPDSTTTPGEGEGGSGEDTGSGNETRIESRATTTYTGTKSATVDITVTEPAPTITLSAYPANDNAGTVSLSYISASQGYGRTFAVSCNTSNVSYTWTLNNYTLSGTAANSSSITLYSTDLSSGTNTLSCVATDSAGNKSSVVTWTISNTYTAQITASATVYDGNSGYYLSDVPDEGTSSVVDQINSSLTKLAGNRVYIDTITFTSGNFTSSSRYDGYLTAKSGTKYSETDLSNISFVPTATLSSSTSTATATYDFTLTTITSQNVKGDTYYGTLTFTIKQGSASGSDIVYAAQIGENISLDSSRFQDFWAESYPSGSLSYVEFTSISGGSLYANYSGSKGTNVVSSSNPTACYVNPTSRQTGLDDLTLVPSSSSKATTVTIRFTARGSSRSSSSATTSKSGTVTVLYMNSSAKITYDAGTNGSVTLNPDDFTAAYKSAMGSAAPSGMTIRFTSLPANGTLTYQSSSTRSVTLTAANMGNYDFTTRTTGSTRISDVTYTASSKSTSETAEFVCYSGGAARFAGTITFTSKPNVVENLSVNFTCTTTGDTAISAMSFYNSSVAVSGSSYIVLSAPTSGSLYLNGSALSSGARLSFVSGTGYPLFSNVTYRPASNTPNGVVTFTFMAYNASNVLVASGTASITVNLPAATAPTTPTTPTNPVLPTNPNPVQLTDVPAGSWYATYVNALVGAGIIGGYNDNTFRPQNDVTYGETLALIMRAVGYNIQQGSGSNWAMPYLTQAAADGLLPSNKAYGLGDSVDRYAIAEITAKAMGLTPVMNATSSPFSDTKDPYVLALHNAGIIGGTGSGYEGDKTFSRAEVAAVVYRIYLYNAQNTTQPEETTQPEDTSSTTREPDRDAPWGY